MKHRAGLTPERKKSAIARCEDIEAALHSLLFDVLNGMAYTADLDKVSWLMTAVQRLRYRFESYPELPAENEARILELIDAGYPPQAARTIAKQEAAAGRRRNP